MFISWVGDIYSNLTDIIEKKWRGYDFWFPYNEKQIESTIELVKHLCCEYVIPLTAINHNTKIDNVSDYNGILYKSNFEKYYTDLSPSWPYEEFKNKIELK